MNRRSFFRKGTLILGTATLMNQPFASVEALSPAVTPAQARRKKIGLQLYSLREDMGKDADKTLKAVSGMGYQTLESYGYREGKFFGKTPADFKKQLADLGMVMTSSHTGFGVYNQDTQSAWDAVKKNMEDTRNAGSKWITQAGYPGSRYTTLDEVKKLAGMFNRIGELAKAFGLKFAYHNHTDEFRIIEHKVPYQVYLEETDKNLVTFQMDIGHVANAMGDYEGYLLHYPGRFAALHIRDTDIITKHATEFGKGHVRFKDVFGLFDTAGVEDYYVEQEEYDFEPLVSVKNCYDFLAAADYVKW